ncbi:MAG: DUF3501 family protein [Bacteroidota bacterium]
MQKISRKDILDILEYEKIRPEIRKKIIDLKKRRRVAVGPKVTMMFENKETVKFQIQEMLRIERIVDEEFIKQEIETYNALIPNDNELSASLFIEITEKEKIKPELDKLLGLEKNSVFLKIGRHLISGYFDEAQFSDSRISAVQYIRFPFTPQQIHEMSNFNEPTSVVINHPTYKYDAEIPLAVRTSIIDDFGVE